MKKGIHPIYFPEAKVTCACGNTWVTGSTKENIRTDVCSNCHPFYTGEQRIVDTEGQVDRFYKKLQARQDFIDVKAAKEAERLSPDRPLSDLNMTKRGLDSLLKAELVTVGDALDKLSSGETALLAIDGFGRKSLADLKKGLRKFGYKIPLQAEEITV